jgi:LysR family transcriptional activator of nhaA
MIERLNYLHLHAFWMVARRGGVTRAAGEMRVAQSAVSTQIRALEEAVGHSLFLRVARRMELTETGRVVFDYAQRIFDLGGEMLQHLADQRGGGGRSVRVGAVSILSKNLQYAFIEPVVLSEADRVTVEAGELRALLPRLLNHQLDVLISPVPAPQRESGEGGLHSQLLLEMPVYLVGRAAAGAGRRAFPKWLHGVPVFLPSERSPLRTEFDAMLARAGVEPTLRAEVDDMALLRLLALSGSGYALVPEIVVQKELEESRLLRVERVPGLVERYYALTATRHFPNPLVGDLVDRIRARFAGVRG